MADNKLKEIDMGNHTYYLDDLINVNDLDLGNLLDGKSYENIYFFIILDKNILYSTKPLCVIFHKIN